MREMQGRPLAEVAPLIARFLTEQKRQTARREVLAELRRSGASGAGRCSRRRATRSRSATDDPQMGNAKAPMTVVEFSDFQCPYCQRAAPTLQAGAEEIRRQASVSSGRTIRSHGSIRWPKGGGGGALRRRAGKYWPYHDRLFANQQALAGRGAAKRYARDASLDTAKFDSCLDSSKYAERVRDRLADRDRLGVSSTPTIFINGRVMPGAYAVRDLVGGRRRRARG